MHWEKIGRIFKPDGSLEWSQTHAQVPVADVQGADVHVYYSTRDSQNRSWPGRLQLDPENLTKVISVEKEPLIELGELGTFDDCGVMPSWVITVEGVKYLYYIGWNVRNTIPYHNSVGLLISEDQGRSFKRISKGPLWDRGLDDPFFSASTCVLRESGIWRMWYLSCTEWINYKGKSEPRYHIKYAESNDGIYWKREGKVAIDYKSDLEGGIVKASVVKDGEMYKMWYSYRLWADYREAKDASYRIGYAESNDGIEWKRLDDKVGIDASDSGWDAQMLAYPHVFDFRGSRYMLYNGNDFGQSGFGLAKQ